MTDTNVLIFTDLDGTLLDHKTYSWEAARPAITLAKKRRVPVILCSSKTLSECLALQQDLDLEGPVIFENGCGIALPKSLFSKPPISACVELENHWLCGFGTPYKQLRKTLLNMRAAHHYQFKGFGDMSAQEVAESTGLQEDAAGRARQRHYSEPLLWLDNAKRFDEFSRQIRAEGLSLTRGGRFVHVIGKGNKGMAMLWLAGLYELQRHSPPFLIALGDSMNDLPMLKEADTAVIVRAPHKNPVDFAPHASHQQVIHTQKFGPEGWNEAIHKLLKAEVPYG